MTGIVNLDATESSVALPVTKKNLGEFISGLLGQPQSLERRFVGSFSADHQWFIHFFSLIFQRIKQQNAPEPLAFEATIKYRDELQRKVTTWQAFKHFSETQNVVSEGVKFNISLLIQFPTKQIPEKQELIIEFNSRGDEGVFFPPFFPSTRIASGNILVEIRHTERTWADDMLRLIETEISHIQTKESSLKSKLRKMFFPFYMFAMPFIAVASAVYQEWSEHRYAKYAKSSIESAINNKELSTENLHLKTNMLLSEILKKSDSKENMAIFFVYFMIVTAIIFIGSIFLARPTPSFVLLSQASFAEKNKALEKLKKNNVVLIASIIFSIFIGVCGNYAYEIIKNL
jgi:hypothetical protein